ncbi:MAG: SPOR domain-containing protein [Glaciecola sp.]
MKQKSRSINTLFISVLSALSLSACSSLPFMAEGESEINTASVNEFSQFNQPSNDDSLKREVEDFKSMKESLSRLVALESDLNFLLEEMSRFNEKSPVIYEDASIPFAQNNARASSFQAKDTVVFSSEGRNVISSNNREPQVGGGNDRWASESGEMNKLGIARKNQNDLSSTNSGVSTQGVNAAKFESSRNVELAPATPIMQMPAALTRADQQKTAVSMDKFKQDNVAPKAQVQGGLPRERNAKADMSKFSTDPSQIIGDVGSCMEWKSDKNKTYALHLASYTSRTAAESGWNKLDQKYQDLWCDTPASLAKVVVKGTEYLSLRVGGYDSRDKVLELCSEIKQRGDYCAVSTAVGERIQ